MTESGALCGLRVIDLTQDIAGPYSTKLMAGFGAEVIKVEPPKEGDRMRGLGPFVENREGPERSIPFLWLNTGKKGIALDLEKQEGVEILKGLVERADVLVESFQPGFLEDLDLGYEEMKESNRGLIFTSITGFGQMGPYKDFEAEEIALQAMSGIMYMTGDPGMPPLKAGPSLCKYTAGQHAYIATMMALFQRAGDGEGQYVEVSMQESALEHVEIGLSYNLQRGTNGKRGGHLFVPWDTYECTDGYATVIAMPARHWRRASEMFNDGALFDSKYDHMPDRMKHREEYEEILRSYVTPHGKRELFDNGQERGLAFGFVASVAEAAELSQHEARGFFVEDSHPVVGDLKYCGAPFRMSETAWLSGRAPMLGEHNDSVYSEILGYDSDRISDLRERGII